ncbi:RIP metalloprotease RseP [Helicobacter didelphidarum]|uniref:Zinc metalloprotease n=1 Tax=Helicobacter didelphidarum TaxID=2040648 RepID=A0A3D8IPX5_9HELI|nr:RIP metalloprotease RseP [Helicobacter didelphidarum]RDU66694.1 RIP metalloprotease RseP [Helicobacter didelphidarum]
MGIISAILALSFLIFFHELGHFLVARMFGVRVEIFSLGFGAKIFSFSHNNTEYRLSLIPLGGYVKLKGEIQPQDSYQNLKKNVIDMHNENLIYAQSIGDSLNDKHPLQRIIILFAGPFFNFLIAFLLYLILIITQGVHVANKDSIIGSVNKDFAAYNLLQPYDKIISINDLEVKTFQNIGEILNQDSLQDKDIGNIRHKQEFAKIILLRPKQLESFKASCDKTLTYADDSHMYQCDTSNANAFEKMEIKIPISIYENKKVLGITALTKIHYPNIIESLILSYDYTKNAIMMIYDGLQKLIAGVIGFDNISGVIGIAEISAKAYQSSFTSFLLIIALISVNLGILNLLPLPLLDGGQIVFTTYEWITKKPIHQNVANLLVVLGFSFIVGLMLLGVYNDITRIAENYK